MAYSNNLVLNHRKNEEAVYDTRQKFIILPRVLLLHHMEEARLRPPSPPLRHRLTQTRQRHQTPRVPFRQRQVCPSVVIQMMIEKCKWK